MSAAVPPEAVCVPVIEMEIAGAVVRMRLGMGAGLLTSVRCAVCGVRCAVQAPTAVEA